MNEEQLSKYFNIRKFDKPYEPFYERTGFNDNEILVNTRYWWTEALVVDKLLETDLFDNSCILKTRELYAKPDQGYEDYIFKGPLSPIDLWIPQKAFVEVRYTSNSQCDTFGYNYQLKNISWIRNWVRDLTRPDRHKYKIYLAVFHFTNISLIDLSEKSDDWYNWTESCTLNVTENHCVKRLDVTGDERIEYTKQAGGWR